ncbi:Cytoplasmic protein nck2 [Saguinus oedipus]|uniref:Cytoplasmic protein nck2 n=1 Tax=Saguinus oedipus TaxID=9490 RepID=A0ABQ9ULT1_SAGOE|nr:Cytoplasmic protein nck2 [Saguinus oedipus]
MVRGEERGQRGRLCAVQLRGAEQPEGLPCEEPEGHTRPRKDAQEDQRGMSPTPNMDAEYPAIGTGADRIYDLNIPTFVKFAYVAKREDELSLVKGSRVTVMENYNEQISWFPSNYVLEEVDEAAAEFPSFLSLNGQGSRVLHVVQTLYSFSSVTEEELNFEKGETMEVIEKAENNPEWWKCKNAGARDSESSLSDFSVSLTASGKNKHCKVQLVDNVYCIGQRSFHTKDGLVEQYEKGPIFTSEHGEKLYVVRALQ